MASTPFKLLSVYHARFEEQEHPRITYLITRVYIYSYSYIEKEATAEQGTNTTTKKHSGHAK